uniref:Retrovirus-related Pol polyprotein from transposon TNT 1-94 n=1 Tax=Tanacetum cinerariifolium TaxID=118510 RepID=A0A6L2JRF6_TANCI|nr:retrovirus-related Pol polyprotein from transposon TNT 1-94 [Tanacetum cinerariifolium]
MLSSIGVKPSTSASESQSSDNTKKDKIQRPPSSTQKNKVEAHPRTVKSSLKNKNCDVEHKGTTNVYSKHNANSKLICVKFNGCMLSDNHDLCVLNVVNDVNARHKSKSVKKTSKRKVLKLTGKVFIKIGYTWRPTSRTFTIKGNVRPLTRITTTAEVPLRKPTALETDIPKPVATLVYSRKPRKSKTSVPVSKPKIIKSIPANNTKPSKSCGSIVYDVPSSSLDECRLSKLFSGTVKFGNDHVAKIMGYVDYHIGNVTISKAYYVEGLGHKLFSVRQFCDSNLDVAFRQHTYFIHNLEEAIATACYTQNRSIIRLHYEKTPYELLHDKLHDLSFFYVFGALCYSTNDSDNLGKLQLKADIGIFIGYAPTKKEFQIYNRRTRRIIKTIHVDFDELITMASEHSSLEPVLHEMTLATISSGLVPNPPPSTLVDPPAPEVIAPIAEAIALKPAESTSSPSSITVDQDAPTTSNSQTTHKTQSHVISNDAEV